MKKGQLDKIKLRISQLSAGQGFDDFGVSRSQYLEEEAPRLETWLKRDFHGKMKYMENWFDMRLDPSRILPGAKTVITFIQNYYPAEYQKAGSYKVAKYAYGEDYHFVIKRKLKNIAMALSEEFGEFSWRAFVDSGPMLDRVWAKKAGLGWIGKNSLLLNKDRGSFFFIGHLVTDLDIPEDLQVSDHCGTCTRCIDACPTDAIPEPYVVDGSKCISYFTIELKESIPSEFQDMYQDWVFGCDICQDVCPWTSKSKPHSEEAFDFNGTWQEFSKKEWEDLDEISFKKEFKKSAIKRVGYQGIRKNVDFLKGKQE